MAVELEYYAAQREAVRRQLNCGLFDEYTVEDIIANVKLRKVAREDDGFVDLIAEFLSGRVDRKVLAYKMKEKGII